MAREGKHEFRVVLDGIELSDQQRNQISLAVQKAALEALAKVNPRSPGPLIVGHTHPRLRPEWLGIWVIDGARGLELGEQIEQLGRFDG
ncbi:hypothetical protein ACHBTE_34135 [Streptomyces sp. M41]|uniref:hypothetical protein n=1 Tax=Streptomyces sp. M41 TaxID=3059412 RepID=UPI00374D78C1